MDHLQDIELNALVEMLVAHTNKITAMIRAGITTGEDYSSLSNTILAIQSEIQKRRPAENIEGILKNKMTDLEYLKTILIARREAN